MADTHTQLPRATHPRLGLLAWLALTLPAAWFLSPALDPVHVEGFTGSIVALGLHLANGTLGAFDPGQPLNAEYFGLTKLGAVLGVAGLAGLGMSGDAAMRLLMWIGFALLLGGSMRLIREWSGAPWWAGALALLLMPGVAESAFFFNDNVLSAGLFALALALFFARQGVAASIAAGVLIGLAVAVRTDTIILSLAVPLMAAERQGVTAGAVRSSVIAGLAAVATLFALFAPFGATPFDALKIGSVAVSTWDRPPDFARHALELAYFGGIPAGLLAAFGVLALMRERRWLRLGLLAGLPALFNLALLGSLWEVRQFLALTPFLGALVALGIMRLVEEGRARRWTLPLALAVTTLLVWAGPLKVQMLADGPRALVGRVHGIPLWKNWQESVRQDFRAIDGAIGAATPGAPVVLISDNWNEDRYLHLRLVESGFGPGAAALPAPCAAIGEAMRKGGRTVVHLRLQHGFVPYWAELQADRLERFAMPCIQAVRPERVLLLGPAGRLEELVGAERLRHVRAPWIDPRLTEMHLSPTVAVELSPELLTQFAAAYRRAGDAEARAQRRAPKRLEEGNAATAARLQTAFSP
jgi:hypothetical protein